MQQGWVTGTSSFALSIPPALLNAYTAEEEEESPHPGIIRRGNPKTPKREYHMASLIVKSYLVIQQDALQVNGEALKPFNTSVSHYISALRSVL